MSRVQLVLNVGDLDASIEISAAATRMQAEGAPCEVQESTTRRFAMQDKVWVTGPAMPWEIYTMIADASVIHPTEGECCVPAEATAGTVSIGAKPSACC